MRISILVVSVESICVEFIEKRVMIMMDNNTVKVSGDVNIIGKELLRVNKNAVEVIILIALIITSIFLS